MTVISVEQVDKFFGSRQVLHGIGFRVAPGEILGLLGPNGSGKTTTLRLLAGYYTPDAGRIRVVDEAGRDDGRGLRGVGYLPERAPLYDSLTVDQYLAFVGRCKGLSGAALDADIGRAAAAFDLEQVRRTAIGRLSKGFRQRVGLAQAILGDPSVLLLDEATNGLDPIQIVEARAMIRRVAQGRAVVFSSHLMQEVQALCTRAVVLRHGRVIADMPIETAGGGTRIMLRWRGADPAALLAELRTLGGLVASDAEGGAADGSHCIECRFEQAPDSMNALLAMAMRHGSVVEARRDEASVETLLIEALRRSEAAGVPG